jgi:hypothetical protein
MRRPQNAPGREMFHLALLLHDFDKTLSAEVPHPMAVLAPPTALK